MSLCPMCREREVTDPRATYCGKLCRQQAWRLRRRRATLELQTQHMRLAYADPPYPGMSAKYYRDEPSFAGEVDHRALIEQLSRPGAYDGWALSTSAKALRDVLPLCPPHARVCSWVKPIGACPNTFGLHNTWEPVVVVPARRLPPGVRDWIQAQPARFGGELPGRKPIAVIAAIFDWLGALPGDSLDDLFPGTGIVGRCWDVLSLEYSRGESPGPGRRRSFGAVASARVFDDTSGASAGDAGDTSPGDGGVAFQAAPDDTPETRLPRGRGDTSARAPDDTCPSQRVRSDTFARVLGDDLGPLVHQNPERYSGGVR